jgi:hypothetical protein
VCEPPRTIEIKTQRGTTAASNTCYGTDTCSVSYNTCGEIGQYTAWFTADGASVSTNAYYCNCVDGTTQCSNGIYQVCSSGSWQNAGTDSDADSVDQECEDTTCDNAYGVCDTAVTGKCIAKTVTETDCADGLDNDCDGLIDNLDYDCCKNLAETCSGTGQGDCCDGLYCSHGVDGTLPDGESHCCTPGEYWDPDFFAPGVGDCVEQVECYPEPLWDCGYIITSNPSGYFNDPGCFRYEPLPYERACCLTDIYGDNDYHYINVEVY